jgi:hypothetical protein
MIAKGFKSSKFKDCPPFFLAGLKARISKKRHPALKARCP